MDSCYHKCRVTKLRNKFHKFSINQQNHLKYIQKSLEAFTVAECMSLQNSDGVAPFIKLSVIRKFYCHCLENLKAPMVSVYLLKLNLDLEATSSKKKGFISFKDDLAAALEYSQEHLLQNNTIRLSRAAHIHFNTVQQKGNLGTWCHTSAREMPFSIYVAFLLLFQTRRHLLIDKFHDLGLCISYDQSLVLLMQLGNGWCMQFESDGVICPTKLCSNVFTTFAVDNIDQNSSSHSTKYFWHGTAISLTQYLQSETSGISSCLV